MAIEKRSIGLFGMAGILAAALIIAGFVFAGDFLVSGKAVLTIDVMDKPVDLERLELTIDSISIQNENGDWVTLEVDLAQPFDLLALQYDSVTLSETAIPADTYTMIKMSVSSAVAHFADGTELPLTVPSNVLRILPKPELVLEGGSSTTVLVDLQPDDLSSIAISNSTNLRPVIKAIVPQSAD
jgi:hypothetical protein